ncbi:MAG: TrkH family potassium uptake protein [Eubacteriales bacterium]|nr:TrkH family potassium uptake protein [Eubacteriales bacterium]
MNNSIIFYIIGWILKLEAAFMLLPCATALIYRETAGISFLIPMALCLAIGIPLTIRKPENKIFYLREGYVSVSLSWIVLSIAGALPFVLSGVTPNPVDALFETVSGFTTTGASILMDVEAVPHCLLMWRSFTHWIGGMGVLVFLLILLPLTGGSRMNLMKAESPGPSVGRLVPKVKSSARILYSIYIVLTILEFVFLLLFRMPVFDAFTTAIGTAGTGGFGIRGDSIASYSTALQIIITIFMILFGINFNFYFLLLQKKWKQAFTNTEVLCYLGIIAVSIVVISANIRSLYGSTGESIKHAAFQVGSIITTTGFATTDFNLWPGLSCTILVLLMFVGACAGSTGGGIKISRFLILFKSIRKELMQYLHPRSVNKVTIDGKPVEHEVIRATNVFLIAYLMIFAGSILLISVDNCDLVTNFTAVAATLNNIGPGLSMVGPVENFAFFSNGAKLVLIFDMLAGRLEIFPVLLLFLRQTWKKF